MYNDDLTFHYREFCVALNQQSMVRQHGRYMVQLCLPREQAAAGEKYSFYYIILSISIVCLILTITIYVVFRKALLRLDYTVSIIRLDTTRPGYQAWVHTVVWFGQNCAPRPGTQAW